MTLRTKQITIEKGRDAGITFQITQMPIAKADSWATRALLAFTRGGIETPETHEGILGIARVALGSLKHVPEEKFIELSNELLNNCVQIITESGLERPLDLSIGDVSDVATLWILRKEALMLHIDFLLSAISEEAK